METTLKKIVKTPFREDRRDFIKKLGSGVIVVFTVGIPFKARSRETVLEDFNSYIRVKEDGRVDLFSGKVEMGQGVYTSLAQVLAEELEVPLDRVDMVMGDTELCLYDAGTWGSMTTPYHDPLIRAAGAEARETFLEMASMELNVGREKLKAENGIVFVASDKKRSVSYAELVKGKKIIKSVSKPVFKKASEFKITGKPVKRLDGLLKVTGKAQYAGDILLPGMLHARIKRPESIDATLVSVDTSEIDNMEGLVTVRDGNLFAVLHESPDVAQRAIVKVKAKWDTPEPKTDSKTVFKYLVDSKPDQTVIEKSGNIEKGRESSDSIVEKEYLDGYKAHASIETHTATAEFRDGKMTMWVSSQTPFGTRQEVADALGLPLEKVHLKQNFIGGGFGGKIYNQQAIEAAKIARQVNKPVQLVWSREEEFLYDRFRPAAVIDIKAGITESGKITFWDYNTYFAGDRGAKLFYEIPNIRNISSDKAGVHTLETGAWRAPGNSSNTFARESHIDILARRANMDPVEFRLNNLKNERVIRPLKAVSKKFGWTTKRSLPPGTGWGVALGEDVNVYVAMMAEVQVNMETGVVAVKRVVCSQDMGQVVNPQGSMLQIEGGITMGLGYALSEDIKFRGGAVETNSFSNYEITRFSVTPPIIESVFIDDMDAAPLGGGEPSIICVGAVIANAIYDACGARIYQMPMTPQRVLEAMASSEMD